MCDDCPRSEWEFTVQNAWKFWRGNPDARVSPQHCGVEVTHDMSYPYLRVAVLRLLENRKT